MKTIHPSAQIDRSAVILTSDIEIQQNVIIHANAVIGFPNPDPSWLANLPHTVRIGKGAIIFPGTIIYEGADLAEKVVLEEYTTVGSATKIGSRTRIVYKAQIYHNVMIGEDCVIGALVANNTVIGAKCSVFGALVHRYEANDPTKWDLVDENGPTLGDEVLVGTGAVVAGAIRIESNARIHPNVVVKSNVPRGAVIKHENGGFA